jgi:hypothetical protein
VLRETRIRKQTPDGANRYRLRFAPERPNNCGSEMSLSTFLVLIVLTFGQIAVLTVTLFLLWLAEEFGGSHE